MAPHFDCRPFLRCLHPIHHITHISLYLSPSSSGLFCGVFIQYIIPCSLVLATRRREVDICGGNRTLNPHRSPFKQACWVYSILAFAIVTLVTIIAYKVEQFAVGGGARE